jgi:hypothetical protein
MEMNFVHAVAVLFLYDSRRSILPEEITNIRTACLRAGLTYEPSCSGSKKLPGEFDVDNCDHRVSGALEYRIPAAVYIVL